MYDVVIVGAGISGISAACHLKQRCPEKSFVIVEARDSIGGTWDLFRYPGIRSDSDMHTFGFDFKPWTNPKALADGPSILSYLQETIEEYDLADHFQFGRRVEKADYNSEDATWTVSTTSNNSESGTYSESKIYSESEIYSEAEIYQGRLLFMCSGYYNYEAGYQPDFPGIETFKGTVIHPQRWPEDFDYTGKKVAVIGSGATAVTIVPAMASSAAMVTMIQRSPTYIISRPGEDKIANFLNRWLPEKLAYRITRWRNIRFQNFIYKRARNKPEKVKKFILDMARKELGEDFDIEKHLTPSYNPWDQRLCLIPDSDLFKVIKDGKAAIETGQIDSIIESGVRMQSGEIVEADVLVSATGINLQMMGGVQFSKDGENLDLTDSFFYQGMMFSGVPNLLQTFGYINASWTLRADLNSKFICDLIKRMDDKGAKEVVPQLTDTELQMHGEDWIKNFSAGYMQRSMHLFPKQGDHAPWQNTQNYLLDKKLLGNGAVDDGVLQFH